MPTKIVVYSERSGRLYNEEFWDKIIKIKYRNSLCAEYRNPHVRLSFETGLFRNENNVSTLLVDYTQSVLRNEQGSKMG